MKVVLAPDSFKGSISAADAAAALAAGWRTVLPDAEIVARPMADGGEGTLAAFAAAVSGSIRMPVTVTGPHGRPVAASWLLLPPTADAPDGTAVVELASTSGIELLGDELLPLDAHSGRVRRGDRRGAGPRRLAARARHRQQLVHGRRHRSCSPHSVRDSRMPRAGRFRRVRAASTRCRAPTSPGSALSPQVAWSCSPT